MEGSDQSLITSVNKIGKHLFIINESILINITEDGNIDAKYGIDVSKEEANKIIDEFFKFAEDE